jgi:hypothetical protein
MQRSSRLAAAHRLWSTIRDDVPAEPAQEEKPYVGLHTPDSDAAATPEYEAASETESGFATLLSS